MLFGGGLVPTYILNTQYLKLGNNILRLFYFHHKSLLYVITSGFIKKDDKTDKNQITKAMEIMKTYLEQNHENN